MNGAERLARTLVAGGVELCLANPGTSEMHFVAALDRVDGIRYVLCLFEGVATGAADGFARMTDRPASTLLHLGSGLANGLSNLHNANRARSPNGTSGTANLLAMLPEIEKFGVPVIVTTSPTDLAYTPPRPTVFSLGANNIDSYFSMMKIHPREPRAQESRLWLGAAG